MKPVPKLWAQRRQPPCSDGDLAAVVSAAVDRKRAAHAGMMELAGTKNRAMVKIGG